MNPPKCILWGGYGFGNVGDELTLAAALKDARSLHGDSICILSSSPGYTKALFPDVQVVAYEPVANKPVRASLFSRGVKAMWGRCGGTLHRAANYNPAVQFNTNVGRSWADLIKQCDTLHLVGGGYITELFEYEYYLLPVEVARLCGKNVSTSPLGIGPFMDPWAANKLKSVFHEMRIVTRDPDSQAFCRGLDIPAEYKKDDGFRVREVVDLNIPVRKAGRPVGINFFLQHGGSESEKIATWWIEILTALKSEKLPVEGFCFHNLLRSDFSETAELFSDAGLPVESVRLPEFDFRNACRRLTDYSIILTARFHAAVVGGSLGIPTLAVANGQYYHSKMQAACDGFPTSQVIDPLKTSPSQVLEILKKTVLQV